MPARQVRPCWSVVHRSRSRGSQRFPEVKESGVSRGRGTMSGMWPGWELARASGEAHRRSFGVSSSVRLRPAHYQRPSRSHSLSNESYRSLIVSPNTCRLRFDPPGNLEVVSFKFPVYRRPRCELTASTLRSIPRPSALCPTTSSKPVVRSALSPGSVLLCAHWLLACQCSQVFFPRPSLAVVGGGGGHIPKEGVGSALCPRVQTNQIEKSPPDGPSTKTVAPSLQPRPPTFTSIRTTGELCILSLRFVCV